MSNSNSRQIRIFIKQFSGKTVSLNTNPNISTLQCFTILAYKLHESKHDKVSLSAYSKAVIYIHGGKTLDLFSSLAENGITHDSTFSEILKSWTMGYNVDMETLSVKCPITLETVKEPEMLNCGHVFEQEEIRIWKRENRFCPVCCNE